MISQNSTFFYYVGANFLDSVSANWNIFFILRLSIFSSKSLRKLKGNMFPGRMLLTRKDSIKKKYQNVSLTSSTSDFFWPKFSIFFDLKIFHFSYNFEWKFSKMTNFEIENFGIKHFQLDFQWKFSIFLGPEKNEGSDFPRSQLSS